MMHRRRRAGLFAPLAIALVTAGCGSGPAGGSAYRSPRAPAYLRIYNASPVAFRVTKDGAPLGDIFASGKSTSLARIPAKSVKLTFRTDAGKDLSTVSLDAKSGEGYTIYVRDPATPSGVEIVSGEQYDAPADKAAIRMAAVDLEGDVTIEYDGGSLASGASKAHASAVESRNPGKFEARLVKAGKVLAEAAEELEAGKSYTVVGSRIAGKPRLEILTNNPRLVPVGRQGMSASS